eukprot:m.77825 g.77825  ORF g.77825 m.77825 type:complete len:341 (-) comp14488_c0_seq1:7-1029(-)
MTRFRCWLAMLLAMLHGAVGEPSNIQHVVYATDGSECISLVASLRSLISNTASPERLAVHVFHTNYSRSFRQCMQCNKLPVSPLPMAGSVVIHDIELESLRDSIRVQKAQTQRLTALATYARLFIPKMLSSLTNLSMYIDCDTIVQGDVVELLDNWQWQGDVVLAGNRYSTVGKELTPALQEIGRERYNVQQYDDAAESFNTGVLILNHPTWLAHNVTEEVLWLMSQHSQRKVPLWKLGVQPPLQLVAYNRSQTLPAEWNFSNLGKPSAKEFTRELLAKQKLLHWAGSFNKPWSDDPNFFRLWARHLVAEGSRPCHCLFEDPRSKGARLRRYLEKLTASN